MRAFEAQGEPGTDPDGLAGGIVQVARHVTIADNREAPIVEGDQLGKDLGAQSTAAAGNGIDPES